MSECHENCVGKQACVQLIRNAEATAAAKAKADIDELNRKHALEIESAYDCAGRFRRRLLKAKADKLATLKGAADTLLNYDLSNKSMPEIIEIVELVFEDFIKHRIEAE